MRSAHWRGMALPILCLAISACGKPDTRAAAADPNAPAVIKAPPPIIPSDTIKPVVPPVVPEDVARLTVTRNYSFVGAGMVNHDFRLLAAFYSPDAEFTTPRGRVRGKSAIVQEYRNLAMDGSVQDFQRLSNVLKLVDSTVVDSGQYIVVRKKSRSETAQETGAYASVWRIHPPPMDWVMFRDRLYPPKPMKGK